MAAAHAQVKLAKQLVYIVAAPALLTRCSWFQTFDPAASTSASYHPTIPFHITPLIPLLCIAAGSKGDVDALEGLEESLAQWDHLTRT